MEHRIVFTDRVYLENLEDYEYENVKSVVFPIFDKVLSDNGWNKDFFEGKNVAVKPNLLHKTGVEKCVTTHPSYTRAACEYFSGLGACVVVCDSPGGLYNKSLVEGVAKETGTLEATNLGGGSFNEDYGFEMRSNHEYSRFSFNIINPLVKADVIVNLARLKTHALCEMTAAVKNMFGSVPGLQKPELHYRHPELEGFSRMLVELSRVVSPAITILDAIDCMEGNGPTGGSVRHLGLTMAARNLYEQDAYASSLIGLAPENVAMLRCAREMGLYNPDELELAGDTVGQAAPSFVLPDSAGVDFAGMLPGFMRGPASKFLKRIFRVLPRVNRAKCVGCGKCAESCPPHIIRMENGKAKFTDKGCISCLCCQEMCPAHAISVRRMIKL